MWFKVDDTFYDHPKAVGLSNDSLATWTRAGDWCAKQLTDGVLSLEQLPTFAGDADDPEAVRRDLFDRRLWEPGPEPATVQFHDWLDYNPSRAQVLAKRKSDAERRRRWLASRRDTATGHAVSNAVTGHAVSNAVSHAVTEEAEAATWADDSQAEDHAVSNAVTGHGVSHTAPTRPDPTRKGGVGSGSGNQGSDRNAHAQDDDDSLNRIFAMLHAHGPITREQAAAYRDQVTGGRHLDDPALYVIAAIRKDPKAAYREAVSATAPGQAATRQPPRASMLCRRCGKTDHRTEDCPTLAPGADAQPDSGEVALRGADAARKALANRERPAAAAPDPARELHGEALAREQAAASRAERGGPPGPPPEPEPEPEPEAESAEPESAEPEFPF